MRYFIFWLWRLLNLQNCAYLSLGFYSNHMVAFHYYLIHGLVQHVGASVDCAQSKMTITSVNLWSRSVVL